MKKILSMFLVTLMLIVFVGCGSTNNVTFEGYEWKLTFIQSNKDGSIIGCASEHYEAHKDIEDLIVVDLICSAENGNFVITDNTNNTKYSGTYTAIDENAESIIYDIATSTNKGTAVSSVTKDDRGGETPTLIITIGDYSLNFQS